jgi:hypothetical protein
VSGDNKGTHRQTRQETSPDRFGSPGESDRIVNGDRHQRPAARVGRYHADYDPIPLQNGKNHILSLFVNGQG